MPCLRVPEYVRDPGGADYFAIVRDGIAIQLDQAAARALADREIGALLVMYGFSIRKILRSLRHVAVMQKYFPKELSAAYATEFNGH